MHSLISAKRFFSLVTLFVVLLPTFSTPCTTLFLPQSPDQVVATNMDWATGQGLMYINKRDVLKTSAFVGPGKTALQWTSKYMSLTLSQTGREFPWEGINEKGVSVNMLLFDGSQLPQGSTAPAVNGMQFVQYILDTSATTSEAIANAQSIQFTPPFAPSEHYFVCDATGDCATIENIEYSLVIHEASSLPYIALANSGYPRSLDNLNTLLQNYAPSQILGMPQDDSLTRFAKAAILSSQYLPQDDEFSYALSALQATQEPDTQWQMVFSLGDQVLQWQTPSSPLKSVDLNQFQVQCSTGVQIFHINSQMSGDVTSSFFEYTSAANNNLVQSNLPYRLSSSQVAIVEAYPATTRCMEENATLNSSPNPSSLGQAVVLTAQVTGGGNHVPTGTVKFYNGTVELGTGVLNSNGVAQLTTSALPVGADSLTAAYVGDAYNPPITSPPLSQPVYLYSSQTTLTSSQNPTTVSEPVTFAATVTGQDGGTPTGTVTFSQNGTPVAWVSLTNGQASYIATFQQPGQKIMTASYSGDSNYRPSVSSPLNETVN